MLEDSARFPIPALSLSVSHKSNERSLGEEARKQHWENV